MRTRISFIAVSIGIILGIQINLYSQARKAVFIHGFMGSPTSWTQVNELSSGYRNIPQSWINEGIIDEFITPELNDIVNTDDYADSVLYDMGQMDNNIRWIIIGHSMGGLVARDIESIAKNGGYVGTSYYPAHNLKGIITLGTPHQGAPIADKLDQVVPVFNDIRNKMMDGPDWQSNWGWLGILYSYNAPADIFFSLSSSIGYGMINNAFDWAETYIKASIQAATNSNALLLGTNSSLIHRINAKVPIVPHISVSGIENSVTALRLAGNSDESSAMNNYNTVLNAVRSVENYHSGYNHWYYIFMYPTWLIHHEGMIHWRHSREAIEGIDKRWGELHNNVVTESRIISYKIWIPCQDYIVLPKETTADLEALFQTVEAAQCRQGLIDGYYETRYSYYTVTYTDKSDGLIPKSRTKWRSNESISNDPSAANVGQMRIANVSFDGAGEQEGGYNHQEVIFPVRSYGSRSKTLLFEFTKEWANWWLRK